MNAYNPHNPSEMLHLLVDGELNMAMETPLYAALLENDNLRNELRELIAIRESVRKDVEAYTPPIAATQTIFTRLGYTTPVPAPSTVTQTAATGILAVLKQRLWNPVVTAVGASVITALLFINFSNNDDINNVNSAGIKIQAKTNNSASIANSFSNDKIPVMASSAPVSNRQPQIIAINSDQNNAPEELVKTDNVPVEIQIDEQENYNISDLLSNLSAIAFQPFENVHFQPVGSISNPSEREFSLNNNYYPPTEKGASLIFEIKSMTGNSFPNVDMGDNSENLFHNFSLGAFTPITENLRIGLEYGQEDFGQKFYDISNVDNKVYKVEQNPNIYWVGLGGKYVWQENIEFLANAQPYLHLTLASTSIGPFCKGITGLQFVSENGLGILFGLEGSTLVFNNENKWYSSNKLGITYGMFIRF